MAKCIVYLRFMMRMHILVTACKNIVTVVVQVSGRKLVTDLFKALMIMTVLWLFMHLRNHQAARVNYARSFTCPSYFSYVVLLTHLIKP